jgi:hypothetical protein
MVKTREDDEYSKAFNEGAPDADKLTEGATETPAVAVVIAPDPEAEMAEAMEGAEGGAEDMPTEEAPVEDMPAEDMPAEEAPAEDMPAEDAGEAMADMPDEELSPEDLQRKKSWEGRLRKREEELAAREAALSEKPEEAPVESVSTDGEAISQVLARATEIAQSPEFDSMVASAVEDFGVDIVAMFAAIGAKVAGKTESAIVDDFGKAVTHKIEGVIQDMNSAFGMMHTEMIRTVLDDVEEIANSPDFMAWKDGLDEAGKAEAERVVTSGTPSQVVRLLRKYKSDMSSKDQAQSDDMDANMGVRSASPVRIPARAAAGTEDEYLAAWKAL